jgi:hypothetical protein
VESGSRLGIYSRDKWAVGVCLAAGKEHKLLDCFSVSLEDQPEPNQQLLADRIAQVCRERKVHFAEAAVALDCGTFMQHAVHSEFRDARKIAATVRFDTEEALATDVSDVAVAFRVVSSNEEGTNLDVFTAPRGALSDIILSLQSNGIDPVSIDPDVVCLSRYLLDHVKAEEAAERGTLYALLSDHRGYLVAVSGARQVSTLRTFMIGPAQERTGLLAREALVTLGLAEGTMGRLRVLDGSGGLSTSTLAEKTGLEVSACDLAALAGLKPEEVPGGANMVDFALAYGAALGSPETTNSSNFRNDHMPYLGKKRRVQKAVRFLSICLTILLLAVGIFFHAQLLVVTRDRAALRAKLEPDYLAVMAPVGQKKFSSNMKEAVSTLARELRRVRAEKQGIGADQESISGKLTAALRGLHACTDQVDLNIDKITVTPKQITINGDTASRHSTVNTVQEAMRKAGLKLESERVTPVKLGGRDSFTYTLTPLQTRKE